MSYIEDFEQWSEAINNVPSDKIKQPNEPVDTFVERTETLSVNAKEDRVELEGAGLEGTEIDAITPLSGALRYCQALWMSEFRARKEAQAEWQEQSPIAYLFRDGMLHDFSFAYRNTEEVNKKIVRIREGSSHTDMIQDLLGMAIIGEKYPEPLTKINFDLEKLTEARTISHNMLELLAAANGSADDDSSAKVLRDKAYTLLLEKDQLIREFGRYVFWKDEQKRDRYSL